MPGRKRELPPRLKDVTPVTEELAEQLAAEAERGYDSSKAKRISRDELTQRTPAGNEIPVPTRDEFDQFVRKVAPPASRKRPAGTDEPPEQSD